MPLNILLEKNKKDYSKEYLFIRQQAETKWPNWKKEYYNENFATSKHAKKLSIGDNIMEDKKYKILAFFGESGAGKDFC